MIIVWGIAILALAIFLFSSIVKGQNVLKTNKFLSSLSDDDLYNTFNFEIKDLEDLSIKLNVKPSSVSKMVIRLKNNDLILYEKYGNLIFSLNDRTRIVITHNWDKNYLSRFDQVIKIGSN